MRLLASLVAAGFASIVTVGTASADELVAPVGGHVDATGSHLAYSQPDGERFRLVIDGRVMPVATSKTPFDVDLGTNRRGELVAVYSKPRARDDRDVFWLDLEAERERRVRGAARRGRNEFAPSVSRGRVAFAISRDPRDRLAAVPLDGGPLTELRAPAGSRSFRVWETELAGGVLAFTAEELEDDESESSFSQLWFSRSRRSPKLLHRAQNTSMRSTTFLGLAVTSRWVSTGLAPMDESFDDPGAVRVAPSSGTRQRAALPDVPVSPTYDDQRQLEGYAASASHSYTTACGFSGERSTCRLVKTKLDWRSDGRLGR